MTEDGPVQDPTFTLAANSRKTIRVNDAHPALDLSTKVHGTLPLIAERSMYWDSGHGEACHDSIGLSAPHHIFYLPGGMCQPYDYDAQQADMETYTLVQNPNDRAVTVVLTYVDMGATVVANIPANARMTFNMSDVFGNTPTASGITVECKTSGCGIMVEKANYVMKRTMGMETIGAFSDTIVPALSAKKVRKSGGGTGRMKALESKLKERLIRGGVWGKLQK